MEKPTGAAAFCIVIERIGEKRVSVPQMPVEMGGEAWPESVKIAEAGGLY